MRAKYELDVKTVKEGKDWAWCVDARATIAAIAAIAGERFPYDRCDRWPFSVIAAIVAIIWNQAKGEVVGGGGGVRLVLCDWLGKRHLLKLVFKSAI